VALQLKRQGITRVHPLAGGLLGWMALGFPLEDRRPSDLTAFNCTRPTATNDVPHDTLGAM